MNRWNTWHYSCQTDSVGVSNPRPFSFRRFILLQYMQIDRANDELIELVVVKRRIIVIIRKDSKYFLLHRLEQHRRILLSKETYRTLDQPRVAQVPYILRYLKV